MGKGSARTARTRDEYDATRGALKNAKAAEHDVSKNKNVDSAALDAPTPPNVVGAKHKPRTTPPPSPASERFPLQNLRNASFPEGGQDGNRRSSSDDDNHAGISSDDYAAAVDDTPGPPATLHMEYWMRSEECTARKREHIAKIDKIGGYWGMEDHIERTVFCHGDVVLERNMFPYDTPAGISHWTLWSRNEMSERAIVTWTKAWLSKHVPSCVCWNYDMNDNNSIDVPHYHVFIKEPVVDEEEVEEGEAPSRDKENERRPSDSGCGGDGVGVDVNVGVGDAVGDGNGDRDEASGEEVSEKARVSAEPDATAEVANDGGDTAATTAAAEEEEEEEKEAVRMTTSGVADVKAGARRWSETLGGCPVAASSEAWAKRAQVVEDRAATRPVKRSKRI